MVLPKREMFSREEQVPTASVVIKTDGGQLSLENIRSIQQLVAAAVPKLDVKNVSIVDNAGNLLTNNFEDEEAVKLASNEALRLDQERKMSQQVQNLLEKSIGEGKVRAQVNLEMDFDEIITNEEIYDPDSQVVRSQATVTDNSTSNEMEQPVSVAQNIPNGDMVASESGSINHKSRTEETINYEISKIVRNKVKNSGTIKRLGVAVIVDGIYERNSDGKLVYRERTSEEMEQIRSLVKSAVGFDAERGDMVEVANMQFASNQPEIELVEETLIMGFTKEELMRIAEGIGVAIVAILVILLVIRPLINNAFESNTNGGESRLLGDNAEEYKLLLSNFLNEEDSEIEELINMNKIDGRIKVSSLKKINDIVEKNPDAAVNIIRGWLYSNDGN